MNERVATVRNLYYKLEDLSNKYHSGGDKFKIIVLFKDLWDDISYHYNNSVYSSIPIYNSEAAKMFNYAMNFAATVSMDHSKQINLKSSGDTIDNIIEYYEKVHNRDNIINNILNE